MDQQGQDEESRAHVVLMTAAAQRRMKLRAQAKSRPPCYLALLLFFFAVLVLLAVGLIKPSSIVGGIVVFGVIFLSISLQDINKRIDALVELLGDETLLKGSDRASQ